MNKHLRSLGLAVMGAGLLSGAVSAQSAPPIPPASIPDQSAPESPASNPVCVRLEGQLAILTRGGGDPARADEIRRSEDAVAKQQTDLDHLLAQAKRRGCEGGGFFSLFTGQSAECQPLNARNPADARQSRPLDDRSRAFQERQQLRSGRAAPTTYRRVGAKQLRTAISGCRGGGGARRFSRRAVQWPYHHPRWRRRADWHLSHGLRALLRRLLFPDLILDGAEQIRRRPARLSARMSRRRGSTLQLSKSRRGHQPSGFDRRPAVYRRYRRRFSIAKIRRQPARAAGRARAGPMRSRTPTTQPRSRVATSS